MSKLDDLRRARHAAATAMHAAAEKLIALEEAETIDDGKLAEAKAAFDKAEADFARLDAQVKRAETAEAALAASVGPVTTPPATGPPTTTGAAATVKEKGLTFARMLRTLAAARGDVERAHKLAEKNGDSGLFANQNTQVGQAGGFLVPEDVSTEVIELLRPASVVMAMGVRTVPMPNGNLTMNRRVSGATFSYEGEQQDVNATGVAFGQIRMSAKKLAGLIPISNDLLRTASVAVDRLIRDDAIADAAQIMDRFFLRGPGTEFAPRGFRFMNVGSPFQTSHILAMTPSPNLANVTNDLARLELALSNHNISHLTAQWIMAPRTEAYLSNLRDGNGNLAFPEMERGLLRRKVYRVTTEIPANLGGGGNESELYLIAPQHVMVGEDMGLEIAMSTEAAYRDAAGNLQAAFSRDETLMRLIQRHDIATRFQQAVPVMTGLTWSPG